MKKMHFFDKKSPIYEPHLKKRGAIEMRAWVTKKKQRISEPLSQQGFIIDQLLE